jgi:hypothetical protein
MSWVTKLDTRLSCLGVDQGHSAGMCFGRSWMIVRRLSWQNIASARELSTSSRLVSLQCQLGPIVSYIAMVSFYHKLLWHHCQRWLRWVALDGWCHRRCCASGGRSWSTCGRWCLQIGREILIFVALLDKAFYGPRWFEFHIHRCTY